MKVGELISQLIELKKKHGNVEVFAQDPDYGDGNAYRVSQARFEAGALTVEEGIVLWHATGSYCKQCGRGCD